MTVRYGEHDDLGQIFFVCDGEWKLPEGVLPKMIKVDRPADPF
jgi:hypothetical protein